MSVSKSSLKLLHSAFNSCLRRYASGDASQMAFTFAAPSQVFYNNANIRQVDVPSFSGSFGILPAHVATLAVLKPGVVTVYQEDGSTKKYFVSSGTVTVNDDSSVQVLAEEAVPVENLDLQAARDILSKAQSDVTSAGADMLKLAEGQIAVEVGEALVKAAEGQL
ncbi:ATP synthase subunit delta, mitochondrial-like [Artemia franciscana]|uniref:F-ATPase delta subunit n=1 Tax=Artemia franciscana TaxID=6661 RepID=A0AA88HW56_ARTSF|nr:hypothetical protein QYM36_010054 [Artemia franciscana]